MNILFVAVLLLGVGNPKGPKGVRHVDGKEVAALESVDTQAHVLGRVKRDACGGNIQSLWGVITSPLHPDNYEPDINCTWNITGSPTERIVLNFTSFKLEVSENCIFDHVLVYTDQDDVISHKHGPFCGNDLPPVITSEANNLLVNFKSDSGVQYSGFAATYRNEPCGGVFTAENGKITSPQFPDPYPRDKWCTYEIVAPPQHRITLSFTHFEFEDEDYCKYDHLEISCTTHLGSVYQYERACGTKAPNNITCEGRKISIEFKSDHSNQYTGFSADFKVARAECAVKNGGCKQICLYNTEGKPTCACKTGFVLHPVDNDCKQEKSEGRIVHFNSMAQPNGSLIFSWSWLADTVPSELSGFYFKATASEHTFQISLPPISTHFTTDQLRLYTEYYVALWPAFKSEDASDEKLGKPLTLSVQTPSAEPTGPAAITPWPQSTGLGPGEVNLTIEGPEAWNCKPVGYRLRMEPTDAANRNEQIVKFSEYSANETGSKYNLNVTLSLKPGREYTIFVSACGLGNMGETLVGPETSVNFGTVPAAPDNLCATISDPTNALLEWESPTPATSFEVVLSLQNTSQGNSTEAPISKPISHSSATILNTTNETWNSSQEQDLVWKDGSKIVQNNQPASSSMVLWTREETIRSATIWLNAHKLKSSNYSLPLFDLIPYTNYEVHIRACAAETCSEKTSATFRTTPSSVPTAVITRIFSNDTSSIHVEWSVPRPEDWLDLGLQFEVRAYKNGVFRLIRTNEKALTISDLSSNAQYAVEVRPSLEVAPGRRKYGNPARATVRTWLLVPLPPTLSIKGYENSPDAAAVAWVFVNSTVGHVQVATNSSAFVDCQTLPDCDIVVLRGSNSSFEAGFVKISGLIPHKTYAVSLRGCNNHGCGYPTIIHVTTGISVPSEPLDLHRTPEDGVTALLEWKPPLQPNGPLTGYLVSWECVDGSTMAATTTGCNFTVTGLPTHPQECFFSVSAYHVGDDGEELRGKPATLTRQWPRNPASIGH